MKKKILVPIILCLILAALYGIMKMELRQDALGSHGDSFIKFIMPTKVEVPEEDEPVEVDPDETETAPGEDTSDTAADASENDAEKIDFEAMRLLYPDIYAWIKIPGLEIDYPIVQHPTDDTFYLSHGPDKNYSASAAVFTERAYNGMDFTDKLTVVYGHRMYEGDLRFGYLQPAYTSLEALEEFGDIVIYMPESEKHYQVFAALPYDNRHIMYTYGQKDGSGVADFLKSVQAQKGLDVFIDEEKFPDEDDDILVLSTCLYGDKTQRYLVVGRFVEEIK